MRKRIIRAGIIAAEAAGVLIAALIGLSAFLFWRVQAAPVELGWASPAARAFVNHAGFDGVLRDIGSMRLSRLNGDRGYRLTLTDVRLGAPREASDASLPLVNIEFHPKDLLSGKSGPRRILVDQAKIRIVRRSDRRLKLDFGEPTRERSSVFRALTGGAYFRDAFERASIANATVVFSDEASGRTWTARNSKAAIRRVAGGYAASLAADFDIGGATASLGFNALYDIGTERIACDLSLVDAPIGDLIAVLFNANADLLTSLISGEARVNLTTDGAVISSKIDLHAGPGLLTIGGWTSAIDRFGARAAFDPARNEFSIERVEWRGSAGEGALGGRISLVPKQGGVGVARVNFELSGEKLSIDQPQFLDGPLLIEKAVAEGFYDVREKKIAFDRLNAAYLGVELEGAVSASHFSSRLPAIAADLRLEGSLGPGSLLEFWPRTLASGARDFVASRMPKGVFSDVRFKMDLPPGAVGEDGVLPDDSMILTFRADRADVIYAPEMTRLSGVAGDGVLKGNSFRFDAEEGAVGDIRITESEVEIPVLAPKGAPAFFRFTAQGDAGAILAVLDQPPLAILADSQFSPPQFSGPARARVEIQRPNLRVAPKESYRYKGIATFTGLGVNRIIGDAALTDGEGRLDLTTDGMLIKGEARIGDAPVAIEWRQKFSGDGDKTAIEVKGVADSATADLFGVPTRQLIQGSVPFVARAAGDVDSLRALDLEADLTGASLVSEALGWMKPQGVAAKAAAQFEFSPESTKVAGFSVDGEGLSAKGSAEFTPGGAILSFSLPTFVLSGAAELSIAGARNTAGVLAINVKGDYLNADSLVRTMIGGDIGAASKTPVEINADIGRVDLRAGATFHDAVLGFARTEEQLIRLDFSAIGAQGKPMSVTLTPKSPSAGDGQMMTAKSGDVGEMLAAIFGLESIRGGEGRLELAFTPGANAANAGRLEAHDLRVVEAPLLAKIFAAGSLTGLADMMNGDGIALENAMAVFSMREDVVRVTEARATGPAIGITLEGVFDLDGARAVALKGAVAPAYQFNSLLGKTPVIGDLFVNRKGEGLLALSYEVDGPASEPRITVNPLSALAPGVFRRMFEGRTAEEAPAGE